MISDSEQQIGYGQRKLIDGEKSWKNPGNHVMYYLRDRPERAFVSEELMLIPEDTELPPDYIQEW